MIGAIVVPKPAPRKAYHLRIARAKISTNSFKKATSSKRRVSIEYSRTIRGDQDEQRPASIRCANLYAALGEGYSC